MYGNRISSQISEKRSGRLIIAILLGLMFLLYPAMVNYFDHILKSQDEIEKTIEDTIMNDPRITSDNLQIDVDRIGTVTLKGFVRDRDEKKAAEQDAINTLGVFMVNSDLKIQPSVSADLTRTTEDADGKKLSAPNES